MTITNPFDHTVIGGGCAGMSLALELAARPDTGRILVIEPRREFTRDRTWCFWDLAGHRFEAAVAHRWNRWRVRHAGRSLIHRSEALSYCELPSDAFYALALDRLASHPRVTLALGTRVKSLVTESENVEISTDQGAVSARFAFDGRPPAPPPHGALLQHFLGIEVEASTPCFDPRTVTLMDFDVSQRRGIHFSYVLPYSATRALVESTYFSPSPFDPATYRDDVADYLGERFGVMRWEALREERGVIPMYVGTGAASHETRSSRIVPMGSRAGLVRPSTGYAFLAIQEWSRKLAATLDPKGRPAPGRAYGRFVHWMDSIFLGYLRRHPEQAPELFWRLFDRVDTDRLARFLLDGGTLADKRAVMGALPTLPFAREAARQAVPLERAI